MSYGWIIPILFHEQAVCRRGSKLQKAYSTCVGNIAMYLYRSLTKMKFSSHNIVMNQKKTLGVILREKWHYYTLILKIRILNNSFDDTLPI